MRVTKDVGGVRFCNHCKGRKTCSCDICVQQGGTCGQCGGLGHFVKASPPLPPEFRVRTETAGKNKK